MTEQMRVEVFHEGQLVGWPQRVVPRGQIVLTFEDAAGRTGVWEIQMEKAAMLAMLARATAHVTDRRLGNG